MELPDFLRGIVLIGDDGSAYRVLKVDTSGRLYAVMVASFGGVMKDVAVDVDGRILMIPTDPADIWGNAITVGNAELAARLGSPIKYQRSGRVIYLETFKHGFGDWVKGTIFAGASIDLDPSLYSSDGYSIKMTTPTSISDPVTISLHRPKLIEGRLGFGFKVAFENWLTPLDVQLYWYTGTTVLISLIRFSGAVEEIQYLNETPDYIKIDDWDLHIGSPSLFTECKFVVDFDKGEYVALYYGTNYYDLSGIPIYTQNTVQTPRLIWSFIASSETPQKYYLHVDNMYITSSEP